MFERFTAGARFTVLSAGREALRLGHDSIGTEHLLVGLLSDQTGRVTLLLAIEGVYLPDIRRCLWGIDAADTTTAAAVPSISVLPGLTAIARMALSDALEESVRLRHTEVSPEHILLGVLREGDSATTRAVQDVGASVEEIRRQVLRALTSESPG